MDMESLFTTTIVLTVHCVISIEILESICMIAINSGGGFINTSAACAVLLLCVGFISGTWLKMLIIILDRANSDTKGKVIIVNYSNTEGKQSKSEDAEEDKSHKNRQENAACANDQTGENNHKEA